MIISKTRKANGRKYRFSRWIWKFYIFISISTHIDVVPLNTLRKVYFEEPTLKLNYIYLSTLFHVSSHIWHIILNSGSQIYYLIQYSL